MWRARRGRIYCFGVLKRAAASAREFIKAGGEPRCLMDYWAARCLEEIDEAEAQGLVSAAADAAVAAAVNTEWRAGGRSCADGANKTTLIMGPPLACSPTAPRPACLPARPPAAAPQPHQLAPHGRRDD